MDKSKPTGISLEQVYVDEVSFKHRDDALRLLPTTPVELSFRISWRFRGDDGGDRALFQMRVETDESDDPLYVISVVMTAVIGRIEGQENMDPLEYAEHAAPPTLMAYMRAFIADLTRRGRFGPVDLPPMNLHLAQREPDENQEGGEPEEGPAAEPTD